MAATIDDRVAELERANAELRRQLDACSAELGEARAQQTATAEVLQVINSSPGDLAPVFNAILEKAHTLCGADAGGLVLIEGEQYRAIAVHGEPEFAEYWMQQGWIHAGSSESFARLRRGEPVYILDAASDDIGRLSEQWNRLVELGGARTLLLVPLRKDDALLGIITAFRQEVVPFSDKQIGLLQNFAAQAVIAIENARLITETREALEQQTATAEVLQVINASPGDLAAVFDTILEKAHALCEASFGALMTYDDEQFQPVAVQGAPTRFREFIRRGIRPRKGDPFGRIVEGAPLAHIHDLAEVAAQYPNEPLPRAAVDLGGIRTLLIAPLRKDGELLGVVTAYRQEVRPFTDKQITLLQNFAAQAVIAMENARLLTETREALEQQTATAEVLQVINSSPGDLAPVFDAILEKAHSLCESGHGTLFLRDGSIFHPAAMHGVPEPIAKRLQGGLDESAPLFRPLLADERFVHIVDMEQLQYPMARLVRDTGVRVLLSVPLRKGDELFGAIVAARFEEVPFSDKQIALLQNFAAQAVIAMENARLLTETREALEQQTATAEVLQVINSSPGDLTPVFDAMLERATRLCDAPCAMLWTYDGEAFSCPATFGVPGAFAEYLRKPLEIQPSVFLGAIKDGETFVHNLDLADTDSYRGGNPLNRAVVDLGGARTGLLVPLQKDGRFLGAFRIYRHEVRPFTDKQIALLQNFAAQAVIAMENARLLTETREALEQQTATAEVLQVINSSPGDLAPVFDAILEKAHSLCGASHGALEIYDGEYFRAVATHELPAPFADLLRQPYRPEPASPQAQLLHGERLVHMPDPSALHGPGWDGPRTRAAREAGLRALLMLPLRKDSRLLGYISANRHEPGPFTEKQIALLQNFAAQAVIAMENARLLTETREALEQQTATAEVLQVINSSPGELVPVFDTILEKAHTLCGAAHGIMMIRDGERFRTVAVNGVGQAFVDAVRQLDSMRPPEGSGPARLIQGERIVHFPDLRAEPYLQNAPPQLHRVIEIGDVRTTLMVPLRKDGAVIGIITAFRQQVRPFTDKQIALLQNFAAQAVIAMENARLLGELRQRTDDLQESLEYQTATSDVLKVISRSGAQLDPVLQTLVETAARICDADKAVLQQLRDGAFRMGASLGFAQEFMDYRARNPIAPERGTPIGRMAIERRVIHIEDALQDPEFSDPESQRLGEFRTMLAVPLCRADEVIGGLFLARSRVEPFTDKQIELVRTFADQAVIAIENARLFNELHARTTELGSSVAELKMLNEVARAVSSTLDLRAVLSTILTASLGLTMANAGAVFRYSRAERAFRLVEAVGWDEALARSVSELHVAETESAMGQALAARAPVELSDLAAATANPLREATLAAGFHSALIVPLVGAERVFGAITLMRHETGEFPPETVRLMQTLASQSVLAIQNARLFREIADKSEQLALASQHKSQFLANMSHELRTPLNAILGYAELLVDGIYGVLPEKAQGVLERVQNNGRHLLALINDVLDLAKIEAGQLTLTLEDYALPEVVRSVVIATEPLAAAKGLKLSVALQDGIPKAHGDARRVSQVLLNLVGNAIKFTDAGEVAITASAVNGQFVLTVRDTGPGIADADQERIFGEFQQIENTESRKKGGTGLGLAISKRMVEIQGGMISVESMLGRGSTFRVVLPVRVEAMTEA